MKSKKLKNKSRILVLAPHIDDGELGCGGTIRKMVQEGHTVYYVAFSAAEKSVPPLFPRDILKKEVKKAIDILGIQKKYLDVLDFEVRCFPQYRQEILESMIKIKSDFNPDMVFLPCKDDTHQDHQTVSSEGFRAFKSVSILGYELPWNNRASILTSFQPLSEEQLQSKIKSAEVYESQRYRLPNPAEVLRSLAIVRGSQIGCKYAEAFELIRWIMK